MLSLNVNESTNFIEFEVSFLNFSTIPSTVDIYIGNSAFITNVVVEGNKITITTKVKYYDNFFNSSSLSVGTRAKTFIKDSVLDLAQEYCKVTFDNPKDIVSKENFIDNSIQISLITLGTTSLLLIILSIILYKKNITFNKENINKYFFINSPFLIKYIFKILKYSYIKYKK